MSVLTVTAAGRVWPSSTPRRTRRSRTARSAAPSAGRNSSAIEGRLVEVVNVDTGEVERETTSSTGVFTFKLQPGKYRVEVTLHDGESLIKQPGVMDLNQSDIDAHADFVVAVVRTSHPRTAWQPQRLGPRPSNRVKPRFDPAFRYTAGHAGLQTPLLDARTRRLY